MKENKKKDSKALYFIQQALHESIFSRIAVCSTSRQAWTLLQNEFQGSPKVVVVKLQTLRQGFETMHMRHNEAVQNYISRMMVVIIQMRAFGDKITYQTVVAKAHEIRLNRSSEKLKEKAFQVKMEASWQIEN